MTSTTTAPADTGRAPQGWLQQLIARRVADAMPADGPNEQFMRYVQNPVWNFLCDHYFRLEIDGWQRIPDEPSLLIGVHSGGALTMDAWTLVHSWHRHFDGRRILHRTAHDVLMASPLLGDYFKAVGVIPASRQGVTAALAASHDVVVWPGGEQDAMRNWRQRDTAVLAGRKGFVRQAIRSGVPIVPVATVGGHDTVFVLSEGRFIARWTGLGKRLRGAVGPQPHPQRPDPNRDNANQGGFEVTNLARNVIEAALHHPDRVALRLDEIEIPYSGLDAASARLAGLLVARGLRPGDRVGDMLPNVSYFAVAYYGVLRAGWVVVPMNVLLKDRETTFYLSDSQAKAVIAWHEFAPAAQAGADAAGAGCIVMTPGEFEEWTGAAEPLDEPAVREDDDTAVILYTSGTTGKPKGAELTHANLRRNVAVIVEMLQLTPEDVILGALPLFHAFGQTAGLNAAVAAGACLTLIPRFTAEKALQIIERDRVTVFEGVPTMFAAMLHSTERPDTSSLRLCVSGGAAMPVEVMRGFEDAFGTMVLEGYGLSETSPTASFNHPDRERKPGSIGTPVAGVEMKLLEPNDDGVGEIAIRGHNVMKGYWNRPDATAAAIDSDGWFHTGDLARVDRDGYYFIVDRSKDMIIRGGYNVYPPEIEEVLYGHPAVREAAVVGVPDDMLGEEVGAAIALVPGAEADAAAIGEFVKARVAGYKYPRRIWLVDELPKGPTGKILKRDIAIPVEA